MNIAPDPDSRLATLTSPELTGGWRLERLVPASRLFGANGLRTGPDGRIYVAQVSGSQLSAVDVSTAQVETISAMGGAIVAPDDCAFDARGDLYVTEVMDARVSVIDAKGRTRVLRDDLPGANGITFHQDRLFVDECRMEGRLLELDREGATPRVLLENLPLPNALAPGPDGRLYLPLLGANEIWRVDPAGGPAERVVDELGTPVALKFDSAGFIVSPQVATGEVLQIDPRSGDRRVLASLAPGLDNLTFVDDRLFVSNFNGEITEILDDGTTRALIPRGLNWPLGLSLCDDGMLYVADGTSFYALRDGGLLECAGMLFTPGYPGWIRGVAALSAGAFAVTTSNGEVARYSPAAQQSEILASGLDQPCGVAAARDGTIFVTDLGTGRVLAIRDDAVEVVSSDLRQPTGIAIAPSGALFVSEAGAGRVAEIIGSSLETRIDGLERPHGLVATAEWIYVVDAASRSLVALDRGIGARTEVARGLPVGAPPGVTPKPLRGMPPFSGPQGPFTGLAAGPDGSLYVSADAEGSVLRLRPESGPPQS